MPAVAVVPKHEQARRMGAAVASLLLIAFAASGEARPNGDPAARSLSRDRMRSVMRELIGFMAIPNVATDRKNIRRNAIHLAGMMRDRGIPSRVLEIEGGPPIVVGEIITPGAKKTLLVYAHYDGQPVDPTAWTDDPWKPVLRMGTIASGARTAGLVGLSPDRSGEWRLYGRSASDDKGTIVAALAAIDILKERKKPLSVNVRYLFEGEEEQGSPHLQAFLVGKPDLFRADGMILCDGPVHQTRRPMVVFGARGVVGLEMTVFGPDRPLHSGHYGNWAPNPAAILSRILGSLRADDGTLNIPGFYDDVRPLSDEEKQALAAAPAVDEELRREFKLGWTEGGGARVEDRIMRPALNVRGLRSGNIGSKAQNAVPAEAAASIDFRLVPDQSPSRVRDSFERAVRAMGFEIVHDPLSAEQRKQAPRFIQMIWEGGYPGYREPMNSPFARALVRTLDAATGGRLVQMPASGGSIPMEMFARVLGLPIALLPIANHDNNQHGPDENIRLQNLWDGVEMHAALLADLGEELVKVAIIDNSIEPEFYRPVEHWGRHLAAPCDAFIAREGRFPDPAAYSHVILTGSEASILEREAWVDVEVEYAKRAVEAGAAVLGSCWGHQLLAFALAGEDHVRRCARPEIGWIPIRVHKGGDLLGPIGSPFVFSLHYDEVRDLPAAFEVLASTDACPVHAFRLKGNPVWGIQSHPEVDIPTGLKFLRDLVDSGFKGREFLLEALGRPPRDSGLIGPIVRAFLGVHPG